MNKEDILCVCVCVYIHQVEYYSALKKNEPDEPVPFVATWMDLEIIILSEVNQMEKDKCHITYIWNLKKVYKWTYLQNRNRPTDIENKFMVTKSESMGRDKLGVWD